MSLRILLGADDRELCDSIMLHVTVEGYECVETPTVGALDRAIAAPFDLFILDVRARSWLIERLGAHTTRWRMPIVLVVDADSEPAALSALERSVDDYLVVPFGVRELVARARALIRRAQMSLHAGGANATSAWPPIVRERLLIEPARRSVTLAGVRLPLTEQEFQLLYVLARRPGVVFERDVLRGRIWGGGTYVEPRCVDALVKRLRRRLAVGDCASLVVTVRGVGYKYEDATSAAATVPSHGEHGHAVVESIPQL